jgi:hypothetical protein
VSRSQEAADEALRRVPELIDALLTLAFIARRCDWDWAAESAAIAHAETLAPEDPEVLYEKSHYVDIMGNNASAIEFLRRSVARDPSSMICNRWSCSSSLPFSYWYLYL